ncbi:toxin VasX, partial [Pseudomonas cremoricolorata]|uniref:toxin VasX n=1 Tax=Pseudomonas cremoricolorata TaxID=157783 RepID=UPI000534B28F
MKSLYKIALGTNRPNQKEVGIGIMHPPCEPSIPIYPLRYGIVDTPLEPSIFPTLCTDGYPALGSGKAYGLRLLRPGSYVYLCYFKDGRMWTQHYQVTEDIRFARIWWDRCDEVDATPGRQGVPEVQQARPYLQAPESHIAEQVYVMISDTLLSHRALWAIETNQDGLRDTLAVRLDPAAGPEQPHAFNAVLVGNATPELIPRGYSTPRHFEWSEIQFPNSAPDYNAIIQGLHAGLYGRRDITPLAVALPDPIGIASELHYLVSSAVERKTKYAGQNAHALQSATLISNYFEAMHKQAAYSEEGADALIRQKKLVKYTDAMA